MAVGRDHDPQGIAEVGGEWIMLAGGGCAILLQIANPRVGRGVAEHSDFAARPYDRLIGTLTYVTAVACGTADDIRAVHRIVGRAHAPVHGDANHDTGAYSAYHGDLQLWVAATLYWTAARVHERVFGPMDAASSDRFYREFAAIGTSLQMTPGSWPATLAGFEAYWDAAVRDLRVLPGARRVAQDLMRARHAPLGVRLIMPWARLATVALLPESVRASYGMVLTARNQRRYERMMTIIATVYPRLPMGIRHVVRDRLLRRLRAAH